MVFKFLTEEYAIGTAFLVKPWKKLTLKDIQELSKKKSRSYVYRALNRLKQAKLIEEEQVGKTILYRLKFEKPSAQSYAGFLKETISWNEKHIPSQIIENLRNRMPTKFFVLLVTGSYARGTQNKNSDLDVVIICDDDAEPKSINAELSYEAEMSVPKVHLLTFRKREFLDMLADNKENYGKEIARNNLIFLGGASYYSVMQEAINHGFKG